MPLSSRTRSSSGGLLAAAVLLAVVALLGVPAPASAAIITDPNCATTVLARNDDGWVLTPLGFNLRLGSGFYDQLFVDNNGYVAFGVPPPSYFGYEHIKLDTTSRVLIAPFLSDVDTRHPDSDEVTYGQTTYGGRPAFCVNWGAVNGVGYFDSKADRRNKFQLLLVERSDTGPGDFDIIMNYDQVQWDSAYQQSTREGGRPRPTWVGFRPGPASSDAPGSGVLPSGLGDGQANALISGGRGTPVAGRYIHEIRGGLPPASAIVTGTMYDPSGLPAAGAAVQLCRSDARCFFALTDAQGRYSVAVPPTDIDGTAFTLFANAPSDKTWLFPSEPILITPVTGTVRSGYNVLFEAPGIIPPSTLLTPARPSGVPGVPAVYWRDSLQLFTHGCPGGTATYTVYSGQGSTSGAIITSGPMTESGASPGLYEAFIAPLYPNHDWATVVMRIKCPDGSVSEDAFNIYIDPSGNVLNANGNPIRGAKVTLYRSDNANGPFEVVPDGSAIMSPANRTNPMLSDASGHFGWDTIAGYYVVRAEKPGCTAVGHPERPYTETEVLPVPPPVTDLRLLLDCGAMPAPALTTPPNMKLEAWSTAGAAVEYTVSAVDAADGSVPVACQPASGSVFPLGTTVVKCTASNSYGNVATRSFSVTVADTTAPTLSLPGNLAAYATSTAGARVTYEAGAVDRVDGTLTPVCSPASGSTFAPGRTQVVCEATDASGNTAQGTFLVHVTYEFGGVLPPLGWDAHIKPNQVVPVRFTLTGVSASISTLSARLFLSRVEGGVAGPESPATGVGGAAEGNLFVPEGQRGAYHFMLSTRALPPGTYQLRIDLGDGATHVLPIVLSHSM